MHETTVTLSIDWKNRGGDNEHLSAYLISADTNLVPPTIRTGSSKNIARKFRAILAALRAEEAAGPKKKHIPQADMEVLKLLSDEEKDFYRLNPDIIHDVANAILSEAARENLQTGQTYTVEMTAKSPWRRGHPAIDHMSIMGGGSLEHDML
jgi:hypothetical protein